MRSFAGTLPLVRHILRQSRIGSALWLVVLLVVAGAMVVLFETGFTPQELADTLAVRGNPMYVALMGPVHGADNFLAGPAYTAEMLMFTLIAVAIMNILFVMRHTRGDEEKNRHELIRSLPVGKLAPLHATMLAVLLINVLIALGHGAVLTVINASATTAGGNFLLGAMLGATGLFFAAVAALAAQLSPSARTAGGYAFAFLGAAYLVRAVGDVAFEPLSLASPLGLVFRASVFGGNYIWPVLVLAAAAFAVAVLAYRANAVRDLEQGFFPGRPGAARGGAFLSFHLGIVWRLHHGTLIAWAIGMFVAGAALGGMLGQAEYFADGELMQQLLPPAAGFSATELFTMFFNVLLAIAAIAPVIMFVFKARTEEQAGRTENVIAAGVCRVRYLAAHAALAFDTALIIPLATAAGMALTAHFTMYDPIRFGTLARALLVYVPALWVVLGLAVFIVGAAPRMAGVVWAFFGYVFLAGLFGDLFSLPSWALRISPLGWVPRLPLDEINYAALTGLSAVAALLTIAGLIAFRRRDIKI